jgi:hypothetical protein
MKNLVLAVCLLACASLQAQDYNEYSNTVKLGGGYTHDFPGLNGYTVFAEFSKPLSNRFRGGLGVKSVNLSGYPRTTQVQEHTKAFTIDFNFYYVPLAWESSELRLGLGYSFSFYNTRRSYPIITQHGTDRVTTWPVQDAQGRASGLTLLGEYEYFLPESNFSFGARASLFKAYDQVSFAGVFGAVRF